MIDRIGNTSNTRQGDYKKVLCVCSGGLLRSATAAVVLAGAPYNYNTRACGAEAEYALVRIDDALICWADEIVVMEKDIESVVLEMMQAVGSLAKARIVCLDIADHYPYRDPELIRIIIERYQEHARKTPLEG